MFESLVNFLKTNIDALDGQEIQIPKEKDEQKGNKRINYNIVKC